MDAVDFHSKTAQRFAGQYRDSALFAERSATWSALLAAHSSGAATAYDIGCGPGWLSVELGLKGVDVVAIDGSEPMLQLARDNAAEHGIRIETRQLMLPPPASTLAPRDLVVSSSVVEYLPDFDAALAFLAAITRVGGTLIFSLPNRTAFYRRYERLRYALTGTPDYLAHVQTMSTLAETRSALARHGMDVIDHSYFASAVGGGRLLQSIGVPEKFTSNLLAVVARRRP